MVNCYYRVLQGLSNNTVVLCYLTKHARSPFVLRHITNYWRTSGVRETVLGVDNAKLGICSMYIYICMDCKYAP